MRRTLAVLLILWLGVLAPPLPAPHLEAFAPRAQIVPVDEPRPPDDRAVAGALQTGLLLEPSQLQAEGCSGLPLVHTFHLINNSGLPATLSLDYVVSAGEGALTGPAQLSLEDGAAVDLDVTLTPGLCSAPGDQVQGRVSVSGNGWTTSAEITHTVYVTPRWEMARQHPVACVDWLVETAVDPADGQEYIYAAGCNTRSTFRYDPRHDTWTTLAARLPDYLYNAGDGAAYQGRIYARSDGQSSQVRRLYVYDVGADAWSAAEVPASIDDRMYYEAVELGGQIYFLGGMDVRSGLVSAAVDRYDPATGTWDQAAPMLHARARAMAWVHLAKIYVAGGLSADGALSSTEIYDPTSDTWTENPALFAPLPAPRYGAGDAVLEGRLWAIGGFDTADSDETVFWSAADNTWHPGAKLAAAAAYVESAALAGHLYTVGGVQAGTLLDYNQRLVLCPDRSGCQGWLEGRVYDAELAEGIPPCTGASLSLTPGSSVSVAPATGRYGPLPLLPGSYLLEACAPGYSLEAADVAVEHGTTTTRDVGLWRPRLEAGPYQFHVASGPGTSLTLPLRITNTGHLALEYDLLGLAPDERPWLSASPTGGEIAPSQAATVAMTFACEAAQVGQVLTGTLGLAHGDPCVAPVEILLEFACGESDRKDYVYLPLLLRAGDSRACHRAGAFRPKQSPRPTVPARTRR